MQQRKQKFLDRGYQDEFGIYDTVIGDPESRSAGFEGFNPVQFQKIDLIKGDIECIILYPLFTIIRNRIRLH